MKSTDNELKYNEAIKYYNNKKYYQSLQLLEELISIYKGSNRAEEVYYYYCMSYYGTGEYLTAAFHLNNFAKTYPASKHAEEAQFLNAYCYYLDSPIYSLDQKSTLDAIRQFQLFINRYPQSARLEECNRLIDELRLKLETKAYNNARLYYKMNEFRSAAVAFENVIKEFPSTSYKEECLFLSVKASYLFAENSIESKKTDRYKAAVEQYYKLIDAFPQSKYLREAERIFLDSQKQITKRESENSVTLNRYINEHSGQKVEDESKFR